MLKEMLKTVVSVFNFQYLFICFHSFIHVSVPDNIFNIACDAHNFRV